MEEEEESAKCSRCGLEAFHVMLDQPKERKGTGYVSCWRCHNVMYEIKRQTMDDLYILDNGSHPFTEEYVKELERTRPRRARLYRRISKMFRMH